MEQQDRKLNVGSINWFKRLCDTKEMLRLKDGLTMSVKLPILVLY